MLDLQVGHLSPRMKFISPFPQTCACPHGKKTEVDILFCKHMTQGLINGSSSVTSSPSPSSKSDDSTQISESRRLPIVEDMFLINSMGVYSVLRSFLPCVFISTSLFRRSPISNPFNNTGLQ